MAERKEPTELMPRPPTGGTLITLHALRLRCAGGADAGRTWTVRTAATIGAGPEAAVQLDDTAVSRAHAQVELGPRGWMVRDLGSRNGTQLDGVPVESAFVRAGSKLLLGRTELVCEPLEENVKARPWLSERFHDVLGVSPAMRRTFGVLEKVAPLAATIVITGPTGAGKGALARAVHAASPRAAQPFIVLDCGSLDANLITAELFGHTRGAFTGAAEARAGVFEAAHGGTLFIDEIGELPLDLQPKLLRVLDERSVTRLGSSQPVPVDVRLVAATHRDLRRMVAEGRFREDLFYRLSVVELEVQPLASRPDDVLLLADHFLDALGAARHRPLAQPVVDALRAHAWPGNVRELRNVIERAVALAGDDPLAPEHLRLAAPTPAAAGPTRSFAEVEKEALVRMLAKHGGNRTHAAAELGVAITTLRRRMRKHGLE